MPDNILRMRAEQKAKELEEHDQSFEAKHARAIAKIDRQLKPRLDALRFVFPAVPPVSERHQGFMRGRGPMDFVIGRCRFCNPDPELFKCVLCDWETPDKWRLKLHTDCNPKWCRDRAAKKIRRWSQHA